MKVPTTEVGIATATTNSLPDVLDGYLFEIDDLVWEHSLFESNTYHIYTLTSEQLSNFDIEVTLKFEDEKDEFHGIVFRKFDEDQYYSFRITPLGHYVIQRSGESSASNLVGPYPLKTSSINFLLYLSNNL